MGRTGQELTDWRPIPGHPLYEASDDGQVRSWNGGRWGRRPEPQLLKMRADRWGYLRVPLGRGKLVGVHRLVCLAFHGEAPRGTEAAHEDGDKLNNRPGNLCWKTPAANSADKARHGTMAEGERNGAARLTEEAVRAIFARRREGARNMDVAAEFGVAPQTVSHIFHRKKWRCVEVA